MSIAYVEKRILKGSLKKEQTNSSTDPAHRGDIFYLIIKFFYKTMKTPSLSLFLVSFFITSGLFAQASSSATVITSATVIDPIRIDKTGDLDFGNVISAYNPGSVVLSPDGSRTAYGVQLSTSIPGNVNPAEAVVTHGNNSYTITLPDSFTLYNQENPDQVVIIDQFTVASEKGDVTDIIKIGATLKMEAHQLSGYYTNSTGFNVTVSYN